MALEKRRQRQKKKKKKKKKKKNIIENNRNLKKKRRKISAAYRRRYRKNSNLAAKHGGSESIAMYNIARSEISSAALYIGMSSINGSIMAGMAAAMAQQAWKSKLAIMAAYAFNVI